MVDPLHLAPNSLYLFLIIGFILIVLYLEQRRLLKERFEEPWRDWKGKAKDQNEFIDRLLTSCRGVEKKEKTYKWKAIVLFSFGTLCLVLAVLLIVL